MSVTVESRLEEARDAQRAAADHIRFCRTPYQFCVWCQWHERTTAAAFARADALAARAGR